MKKVFSLICALIALVFINAVPALACWVQPIPFEIISEDGAKVFVFEPDENGIGDAYAAAYKIRGNERQLIYTVDGLASFAYEGNFYFSSDMIHFVRTFPAPGIDAFEVFSNGVRTRVVMRSDFIENYASIEAETSIGPSYTVTWRIEEYSDSIIVIYTDEGNVLLFDLASAGFVEALSDTPTEHLPETPSAIPTVYTTEAFSIAQTASLTTSTLDTSQQYVQPLRVSSLIPIYVVLALIVIGVAVIIRFRRTE